MRRCIGFFSLRDYCLSFHSNCSRIGLLEVEVCVHMEETDRRSGGFPHCNNYPEAAEVKSVHASYTI